MNKLEEWGDSRILKSIDLLWVMTEAFLVVVRSRFGTLPLPMRGV
jgi:hypothetical protein